MYMDHEHVHVHVNEHVHVHVHVHVCSKSVYNNVCWVLGFPEQALLPQGLSFGIGHGR